MSDNRPDPIMSLDVKLDKLCNGVDLVKDSQKLMADDIAKIKEAVYNPDEGLYARIRALEAWKATSSKMIWTLFTALIGLAMAFILKLFP